jgi:hypothetical protein
MQYCGLELLDTFLCPPLSLHVAGNYSFLHSQYTSHTKLKLRKYGEIYLKFERLMTPKTYLRHISTHTTDVLLQVKKTAP